MAGPRTRYSPLSTEGLADILFSVRNKSNAVKMKKHLFISIILKLKVFLVKIFWNYSANRFEKHLDEFGASKGIKA